MMDAMGCDLGDDHVCAWGFFRDGAGEGRVSSVFSTLPELFRACKSLLVFLSIVGTRTDEDGVW
jgi:hypothetical protein